MLPVYVTEFSQLFINGFLFLLFNMILSLLVLTEPRISLVALSAFVTLLSLYELTCVPSSLRLWRTSKQFAVLIIIGEYFFIIFYFSKHFILFPIYSQVFQVDSFLQVFPTKLCVSVLRTSAIWSIHLILHNLITIIFGGEYNPEDFFYAVFFVLLLLAPY
jgi:hypothetical protein